MRRAARSGRVWRAALCLFAAIVPFSAQAADSCSLAKAQMIGPGAGPDWSRANGLVAYFLQDNTQTYQVYTMRPDGSQSQCLTCAGIEGAPAANINKGSPSWDPTGKYILFQAADRSGGLTTPGSGWWNNLWVMTADGKQFWQLTHYTASTYGVLVPRFSRDGSKVFWAELLGGPFDSTYRSGIFGRWRLNTADFRIQNGTPQLLNTRLYAPGNGTFYESQDWSPDGTKVIFCSDITISKQFVFDIFSLDLTTRRLTNLTNLPQTWNEQGAYSPGGNKISFMSSRNTAYAPPNLGTLAAELFLMDSDGKNVVQLSHFNTPGYPEYTPGKTSIATKDTWSPDGTQILQEQHFAGLPSVLWMFTFAGPCGVQ